MPVWAGYAVKPLIRIDNRKAFVDELNDTQKKEYLRVVEYKITRKKASIAWKKIFSDKEKNELSSDWNIRQAQELTAKRDFLASYICKNTNTHAYLEKENLDLIKIEAHGKQHGARVKTIQEMAQKKGQLLNQLENRISKMNRIEAKTWHKSWDNLTVQVHRIFNNNPLYGKAIESSKLSLVSYTEKQREFLDKHELLNQFIAQKPLKHAYLSQQLSVIKKEYFDANAVNESLTSNPIEAYRAIFGEPKKITSREMRYPGGLIISLKGSKSGCWYDFSMGEGGNPIQAIMRERNISFPEALKEGAAISGITKSISIPIPKQNKNHMVNEKEEDKNKILSARSIVKGGIPIKNTLAERYLKLHRSIENPERLNVLFWPNGSAWKGVDENGNLYERVNKIPALLIPAYNEKNELTGVQRIYLDSKSGKKNTFLETAKLSQGKLENSAGILQKGDKFGRLYLTEGPETGASIAMADPKSTVLVSLGLSNLKNLSLLIKRFNPKEVIIAGDNDTLSKNTTLNITFEAQQYYKNRGIESRIILPNSLSGMEKTDWNDVHKICGLSALKEQLGLDRNRSELTDYSKIYHGIIDNKIDSFVSGYNEKKLQNERELSNLMPDILDTKSIVGSSSLKENSEINIKEIKNKEPARNQITLDL